MPMLSDAGFGRYADVINGAGDRVRQGMQAGQEKDAAAAEQNRALHPATAKWLQKVMNGEMSPADAAAAAHQEIDSSSQPSRLGNSGEQGHGGMLSPASLSPSAMSTLNSGMTGEVPMTQRTLGEAQGIAKVATPYVKADAQRDVARTTATGKTDAATINQGGANERSEAEIKFKDKQLKEKGAQFDAMMAYRYEALQRDMRQKGAELESKERIAALERGGKQSEMILKKDMDSIDKMERDIVALQNEKTRAGNLLNPEQAAASDKMIQDLQAELGHLKRTINTEVRMKGGRPGQSDQAPADRGGNYTPGNTYPPANGGEGPNYTPAQEPIDRSGRLPPARGGPTGKVAPNLDASTDVREPTEIQVREKKTKKVKWIPANMSGAVDSNPDDYEILGVR